MARKIYKYPKWGEIIYNNDKCDKFITQLYEVGVYCIFNNDSSLQFTTTAEHMSKIHKKLLKDTNVKSYKFGELVSAIKNIENSLYKEIEND